MHQYLDIDFAERFSSLCFVVDEIARLSPSAMDNAPSVGAQPQMEELAIRALKAELRSSEYEQIVLRLAELQVSSKQSLQVLRNKLKPKRTSKASKQLLAAFAAAHEVALNVMLPRLSADTTREIALGVTARRMAVALAQALNPLEANSQKIRSLFHEIQWAESWIWLAGPYPYHERLRDCWDSHLARVEQALTWDRLRRKSYWRGHFPGPFAPSIQVLAKTAEAAPQAATLAVRIGLLRHLGHDLWKGDIKRALGVSTDHWSQCKLPAGWVLTSDDGSRQLGVSSIAHVATTLDRAGPLIQKYPWAFRVVYAES